VYNTRGDKVKTLFNGLAEGGKTYRVTLKTDDRGCPGRTSTACNPVRLPRQAA
jgi:hypothetical protein